MRLNCLLRTFLPARLFARWFTLSAANRASPQELERGPSGSQRRTRGGGRAERHLRGGLRRLVLWLPAGGAAGPKRWTRSWPGSTSGGSTEPGYQYPGVLFAQSAASFRWLALSAGDLRFFLRLVWLLRWLASDALWINCRVDGAIDYRAGVVCWSPRSIVLANASFHPPSVALLEAVEAVDRGRHRGRGHGSRAPRSYRLSKARAGTRD
jgi:hypothetical protein